MVERFFRLAVRDTSFNQQKVARYSDGTTGDTLSTLQAIDRQRRENLFMVRHIPFRTMVAVHELDAEFHGWRLAG
jgi:hypothetical protein